MNEFLSTLLQAVLIAAVPVCAAFAGKCVNLATQYLSSKIENANLKKYLEAAGAAVTTAVTYTSQTYVDALKKSGTFTKENQETALKLSIDKARGLLTAEAVKFLENAYGDLNEYLRSLIEAEVRNQKLTAGSV